jgi:hydroxymethylpyrimidine/phosphomethylpyrimidine kinase
LASPQAVLLSEKFEHFDANFTGTGDTLSAALAALLAGGLDLQSATSEALNYLDQCLDAAFAPGMGHLVPDRLFWAQPQEPDEDGEGGEISTIATASSPLPTTSDYFELPPHGTKQ